MPDAPLPPPGGPSPEFAPHLCGAARRYRRLLASGCDAEAALAELVAYLVVLRPVRAFLEQRRMSIFHRLCPKALPKG